MFVFYRMDKRCVQERKYVAALDPRHGAYRPRMGISEGWVPGRVSLDQETNGQHCGEVSIQYIWPHFFTKHGRLTNNSKPYCEWYPPDQVRHAPDCSLPSDFPLVLPGSRPELAIIAFRWGGAAEISHCEQWGDTGSSISDTFFESFLDMAVCPQLGTDYEVWTVYIEDHSDMMKIADTAHLIFGASHPARRARRTCAMYFLYPTAFEEGCVPTMETGSDHGAALVDQKSFFRMMKSVERAGVPSRFPHCSGLYEQLASKRWTHELALTPHLRVPPTVAVPRMLIEHNCSKAASRALEALHLVKSQQASLRGEAAQGDTIISKGVAKLGYSWEALDVKFWQGDEGLAEMLSQLTQAIEISQEMTGQPHDCESLLVQEYIPHDFELRMYTVEGQITDCIYTKFCSIKTNQEFGDFKQLFSGSEVTSQWMHGDSAAMADADRQCRNLTAHWLAWARAQSCEIPPGLRFDYFVKRGPQPGRATVWTLEICELGFSMLNHKHLPAKVFEAMLRSCMSIDSACDADEPSWKRRRGSRPAGTGVER